MPNLLITCIFCGAVDVESSGEDIIPLWLQNKLRYYAEQPHPGVPARYVNYSYDNLATFEADTRSETPGASAIGQDITGARPTIHKLPDVCTTCNGGWMSRLEQAAGKLIPGLLEGKSKVLAPFDQLILATWTVKTSLTYDASYPTQWIPTEAGSRPFFRLGRPAPRSVVVIAHDANHIPEGAFLHSRQNVESPHLGGPLVRAIFVLFQFDCLILGATIDYTEGLTEDDPLIGIDFDAPHRELIWPQQGPFLWPPSQSALAAGQAVREPPQGPE